MVCSCLGKAFNTVRCWQTAAGVNPDPCGLKTQAIFANTGFAEQECSADPANALAQRSATEKSRIGGIDQPFRGGGGIRMRGIS